MKSSPSELKKLRKRKQQEQLEEEGDVKHLGTHETSKQRKFIKIVVWVIAIAFATTTFLGLMITFFAGSGHKKHEKTKKAQKVLSPSEKLKKEREYNLEYYQKQVKEKPEDANTWSNLASSYFYMDQPDEAVKAYKKAMELDPKSTFPMKGLANVYAAQKKYDEAMDVLTKALAIEEESNKQTVYSYMAEVSYHAEKLDDAIEYMKKAIEHDKGQGKFYVTLTQFYLKKDDKENAKKTIEQGIEITKAMGDQRNTMLLGMLKDSLKKNNISKPDRELTPEELERLVKEGTAPPPSTNAPAPKPAPGPETTNTGAKPDSEQPAPVETKPENEVKPEEAPPAQPTAPAVETNEEAPPVQPTAPAVEAKPEDKPENAPEKPEENKPDDAGDKIPMPGNE